MPAPASGNLKKQEGEEKDTERGGRPRGGHREGPQSGRSGHERKGKGEGKGLKEVILKEKDKK